MNRSAAFSSGPPIVLVAVLAAGVLLADAPAQQTPAIPRRTVALTYGFTIKEIPSGATELVAWVPIPASNEHQSLESFRVEGDLSYETVVDAEYGNRFMRFDLSDKAPRDGGELAIAVSFRVTRTAYRQLDGAAKISPAAKEKLARFLAPDRLVPIDGRIAEEAQRVAGGADEALAQARLLYDHIVATLDYDKSGRGWGRGDANYACDVRKGNCTDFHSLFIGEARSLEIPARFVIGLPLPEDAKEGDIPGYHCWAEFYIKGRGWVPVDASEASRFPERKEAFFGGLDENRIEFTTGRDVRIPGVAVNPINYVIYPHVELDGHPHTKVETRFHFREVTSRPTQGT